MIDGSSTPKDAVPAGTEKSKSKSFYEHLVEDGHVAKPGNVQNKGDVASYENSQPSDLFNSAKIIERWEGESKGTPAPEGFDPAKFDAQAIKKRWEGQEPASEVNMDDVGGVSKRKGWRETDPGAQYDEWIKGAGPHSKLGKTYRDLQAKVREANKTQLVPRALTDIKVAPTAKK